MAEPNAGPQNGPDGAQLGDPGNLVLDPADPLVNGGSSPYQFPSDGGQPAEPDPGQATEPAPGSSEPDLSPEYKPYSDIPWDQIPPESREGVLKGVKKMHGGMTRQQQEVAELRRRSQMLDELVNQPWVRQAWEAQQKGQTPGAQSAEPTPDLTEHLDSEAVKAIDSLVNQRLQMIDSKYNQEISSLRQQQLNAQVKTDLAELRELAQQKGWPSPDEKMQEMYTLLSNGEVKNLQTAYRQAIFDDLPDLVSKNVRTAQQQQIQRKAQTSIPPGNNSPSNLAPSEFDGPDAVAKALEQSIRELQAR
mgnify:CR=1 FL=1